MSPTGLTSPKHSILNLFDFAPGKLKTPQGEEGAKVVKSILPPGETNLQAHR